MIGGGLMTMAKANRLWWWTALRFHDSGVLAWHWGGVGTGFVFPIPIPYSHILTHYPTHTQQA